jgi:predicted metallopeptidase
VVWLKYEYSQEWTLKAREIARLLDFSHVKPERICCLKSSGSSTRRTIARIHSLSKVMQLSLDSQPFYAIELLTEKFDRLSREDQLKTIVHELMHIPASFGGGFRHHKPYVTARTVEKEFARLKEKLALQD